MKVLIDANIILDVLQKRDPHYQGSAFVWKLCETMQITGYVSALSFADLVYIMRKDWSAEEVEQCLRQLRLIFTFEDFTVSDMNRASEMKWKDYEDAVQSATAERMKCDYIITRNVKYYKASKIFAVTPAEFLAREA